METPLNPLAQEALASIFRKLLMIPAAWLVQTEVWSEAEAAKYVGAATLFTVSIGWGYIEQRWRRRKLLTAQAMSGPVTETQVEHAVRAGLAPSVTVAKDTAPVLAVKDS